jgi:hypothetical protein
MSKKRLDPDTLTSGDVVEIVNLILAERQYRTIEDCARDIVRAVQRLQEDK